MEKNIAENNIKDNERSHSKKTHLSSVTEAWANQDQMADETNVSIPSDDAVWDAKDWIDNGSKL